MKYSDLIERTTLENQDENQEFGNSSFDTYDWVRLDSIKDVRCLTPSQRLTKITHWGHCNGGYPTWYKEIPEDSEIFTCACLRSNYEDENVDIIISDGDIYHEWADRVDLGLCPAMHLNLKNFVIARNEIPGFGSIGEIKDQEGNIVSHTIELGEYPKTKVPSNEGDKFEQLLKSNRIRKTGKQYTGYLQEDGSFSKWDEYEIDGQKYVRIYKTRLVENIFYSDGRMSKIGTWEWVKVEPVVWRIRNWDNLPKSINPQGNGTAKFIDVRTEEAIMSGIPFFVGNFATEYAIWQNSPIRAFFNGYNLHNEIDRGNGNKFYKNDRNFDCSGEGLLSEMFGGLENDLVKRNNEELGDE